MRNDTWVRSRIQVMNDIREELVSNGVTLEEGPHGTRWKRSEEAPGIIRSGSVLVTAETIEFSNFWFSGGYGSSVRDAYVWAIARLEKCLREGF